MTLQITAAPIRKSIQVNATPERAFKVFTGDMTRWWKPEHHRFRAAEGSRARTARRWTLA